MITVNNINGKPESKPASWKGVHSDSDYFYFFETDEEVAAHKATIESEAAQEQPQIGAALAAFSQATEEEKILMAQELKKYL